MTPADIELMMYQSAIERTKEYAARLKSQGAYDNWWRTLVAIVKMDARANEMQRASEAIEAFERGE